MQMVIVLLENGAMTFQMELVNWFSQMGFPTLGILKMENSMEGGYYSLQVGSVIREHGFQENDMVCI